LEYVKVQGALNHYNIDHEVSTGGRTKTSTKGYDIVTTLEINPVFCLGKIFVKPIISGRFYRANIADYKEKDGLDVLEFYDDRFYSFDIEAGAAFSTCYMPGKWKLLPQVSVTSVNSLRSVDRTVKVHMINTTHDQFIPIDGFKENTIKIDGTFFAHYKKHTVLFFNVGGYANSREKSNVEIRAGVNMAF
jgi:hypothetical protein